MSGKSYNKEEASGKCLSDDRLYRYLEKLLPQVEIRAVQEHLDSCPACFDEMVTLVKNAYTPASAAEKLEITSLRKFTPQQQVTKIQDYVEAECPPVEKKQTDVATVQTIWENIKATVANRRFGLKLWRPIFAVASLITIFLIGRPFYLAWRSEALTKSGLSFLAEHHAITSRDEARPVGGFGYEEFGMTRSEENKQNDSAAKTDFEKALRYNHQNSAAHHYLGTYYLLIENDLDKAKNQYLQALAQDSTNAAILNDLGVVFFHQGVYAEAAKKFSQALQYDARLAEAQYNLATVYQQQDRKQEAAREWEKYLQLETNRKWAEVAQSRLELLRASP